MLWCEHCRKYEAGIKGQKKFSSAWIQRKLNQRTNSLIDHANSNQHKAAMAYLKVDMAKQRISHFLLPVSHSLMNMDATTRERMKHKFDICYVMTKEGIAFSKYPALYDLNSQHDVDLGVAYKNDVSGKPITHYIAQSQSQHDCFICSLPNSHYFSFLMDGTTDLGKVEVVWLSSSIASRMMMQRRSGLVLGTCQLPLLANRHRWAC